MQQLRHVVNRIVVSVNMESKNSHKFSDGTEIRLERKYDCFDQKYTQPVNAIVVSAENIPEGSEILIHHNSTHDTNRVFNYTSLSGDDIASNVRYFAIPESEAYAWYNGVEWLPLPGFDFALRIFRPYKGILDGIEPTVIKDCLYVTTGEYRGIVCRTLRACDYTIIFQDTNGREGNIIRFRSKDVIGDDKKVVREMEIVAIDHVLTRDIQNGDLIAGITKSDAKPIKELVNG